MAYEDDQQTATLVEVANLYYKEELSQREIAERLGVSRSLIALYLQRARDRGIVRIEVVNPQDNCGSLAVALRERTGLNNVIVVPHGHMSPELTQRATASAGAKFLEENLKDGDVLGLVWGRTLTRLVELLAPTHPQSVEIIPLLGESKFVDSYTQMNELVLQTSAHFSADPHFLLAPMMVGSQALRDALLADPAIREVTQFWDQLTIACFGIGVLPPAPGQIPYIGEENIGPLMELGAVGDLCGIHHYDIDGNLLKTDLLDRTIGVSVDQLMNAQCRVGVATGVEKTPGVVGGLHTGLLTTLVIDADLAQSVLRELS